YCNQGRSVQFFVGKIKLGKPVSCVAGARVYPIDLVSKVNHGKFDTAELTQAVSLFLLTLHGKEGAHGHPETFTAINHGPSQLTIGNSFCDGFCDDPKSHNYLGNLTEEDVFADEDTLLDFVNGMRCVKETERFPELDTSFRRTITVANCRNMQTEIENEVCSQYDCSYGS